LKALIGGGMKFEDLEVWKRSARLSADIYKSLATLKDFRFKDQVTRSGLSIPSNIAEGFERRSEKDCIRFLSIARGSSAELRTQIMIGMDVEYIEAGIGSKWLNETRSISAMLTSLIQTKEKFLEMG
jgi:four helix bundle protein